MFLVGRKNSFSILLMGGNAGKVLIMLPRGAWGAARGARRITALIKGHDDPSELLRRRLFFCKRARDIPAPDAPAK